MNARKNLPGFVYAPRRAGFQSGQLIAPGAVNTGEAKIMYRQVKRLGQPPQAASAADPSLAAFAKRPRGVSSSIHAPAWSP